MIQEADSEAHTHSSTGGRRFVCEVFSWPQTAGCLSVRLHSEGLLHRHTEGKPYLQYAVFIKIFLAYLVCNCFINSVIDYVTTKHFSLSLSLCCCSSSCLCMDTSFLFFVWTSHMWVLSIWKNVKYQLLSGLSDKGYNTLYFARWSQLNTVKIPLRFLKFLIGHRNILL